jgi:hypothetical protein
MARILSNFLDVSFYTQLGLLTLLFKPLFSSEYLSCITLEILSKIHEETQKNFKDKNQT